MNRKALLIAYHFPPFSGIAAQRASSYAKYLPKYGWTPAVFAGDWTPADTRSYDPATLTEAHRAVVAGRGPVAANITKAPVMGLWQRRLRPLLQGFSYPGEWQQAVLELGRALCRRDPPDVIWATFSPAASLSAADKLSREFQIPWVADFRDTWELLSPALARRYYGAEARVCRSASAIVTVSDGLAEWLRARHGRQIEVIPNGYDPAEYEEAEPSGAAPQACFTIVYTGTIHPDKQDCTELFAALDRLLANGVIEPAQIKLQFWGTAPHMLQSMQRFNSFALVEWHPWAPRAEVIAAQRSATVLLLLSTPHIRGIMTGKVFEYLAAGRPILSVPGDGDCVDSLLRETKAGFSLNGDAIQDQLLAWYNEWLRTGTVQPRTDAGAVAQYSRVVQSGQLANLFKSVVDQTYNRQQGL